MTDLSIFKDYIGHIDRLVDESETDKGTYVHPALRNLGSVTFVLVREIVAPTVFRNSEAEITDIEVPLAEGSVRAVRAVPNKFKHRERARGLQILRQYDVGGRFPQNRNVVKDSVPISDVFDLNSLVFGDSVNRGKSVLPVKAAALYSDGISLSEYGASVGKSFHNRASEDGTLFDYAKKANSNNLFDRHYVLPGTLLVQTITTIGRVMPVEGLDHLLLTIGPAGTYGGQTSVAGVNVRTHIAGIYANRVERAETSPYQIAAPFLRAGGTTDLKSVISGIHGRLAPVHAVSLGHEEAEAYRDALVDRLEAGDADLERSYKVAAEKVASLFSAWFTGKAA